MPLHSSQEEGTAENVPWGLSERFRFVLLPPPPLPLDPLVDRRVHGGELHPSPHADDGERCCWDIRMLTFGTGFGGGSWADEVEETYGMLSRCGQSLSSVHLC